MHKASDDSSSDPFRRLAVLATLLLLLAFVVSSFGARAQTLGSVLSLEFGKIAASGVGTVTIATDSNTRTKTGSVSLAAGGTIRRGRIVVTGTPNTVINISMPATLIVTGSNGGTATLVPAHNGVIPVTLAGGGTRAIRFGGTLTFTGPVPAGTFSVNVPVTVTY